MREARSKRYELGKHSRRLKMLLTFGLMAAGLLLVGAALCRPDDDAEDEAIQYIKSTPRDPVARLQQQIERGQVKLEYRGAHGYLESVLKQLKIPVSSQTLVFSKTSFQRDFISPQTPRALYFNDHTYIGWVQGAPVLEVSTVDPQLGAVFYVLDQQAGVKPKFVRQTHECMQCHDSGLTRGIPGHLMRSVYPDAQGQPIFSAGTFVTTDQSPLKERWGGWYVTGKHGMQRHLGNILVRSPQSTERLDLNAGANVTDLSKRFSTTPYLTRHSDIVALMVMEHQTRLQNLMTRANYQTRIALHYEQMMNRELGRPADYRAESTLSRIRSVGEPLVQGMLFSEETPLTDTITGTSGFTAEFTTQGLKDKQGRSLREFDLKHRLFRYPCSYQIYSEAFDGLPDLAKEYVYRRLRDVLSGQDNSKPFAHLTPADRKAILEILLDTKPDFAAWTAKHRAPISDVPLG